MVNKKDKKITVYDVANELGVSVSTVSRAVSGKGRIGKETRKKILEYMQENNCALLNKKKEKIKTKNIAIIIPEVRELMDMSFFHTCMYGVNEMALASGYDMFVITTSGEDITHVKRLIECNKVDGIILTRTYKDDVVASFLKGQNIPFVAIGTIYDDDIVQVNYDNESACRDLTSILLSRNIKRIAYLGTQDRQIVNDERLNGYIQAHKNAGIEIDYNIIFRGKNSPVVMNNKVYELLKKKVDCILCQGDAVCNRVLDALREFEVKIPEQIKVASCYSSELLNNYPVSITSLKFDVVEIGRESCRILLNMINEKEVPKRTLLDYEVVMKDSTK